MKYSLENPQEALRLEKQAKCNQYDCSQELNEISFGPDEFILDAGCGSGLVSRYLTDCFSINAIDAFDFSKTRIEQAKQFSRNYHNINFSVGDICNLKARDFTYDTAISRYVFQHLSQPLAAAKELYRVLRNEGQIILIDTDSLAFDLYTENDDLNKMLTKVKANFDVDIYMGRKLPGILKKAGFKAITWTVKAMPFQGEDLEQEYQLTLERFNFCRESFMQIFPDKDECQHFFNLYLDEMMKPENVLFYNKFIVRGIKGET